MKKNLGVIRVGFLIALLVPTQGVAKWVQVITADPMKFDKIFANNGKLLGIKAGSKEPFLLDGPKWKQLGLGNEPFFFLATDGQTIAGIQLGDKCAYIYKNLVWQRLTPDTWLKFDWIGFSKNKLIGLAEQPIARAYLWNSSSWDNPGSMWQVMGSSLGSTIFWSMDTSGDLVCGVERLLEASGDPDFMPKSSEISKKQTNKVCMYLWPKKDWVKMSTQQFQQVATNGVAIYALGLAPNQHVFVWNGKVWQQLGAEKFFQIAAQANILCALGWIDEIKLGRKSLQAWRWTGQKWERLGTRKFRQLVTDGVRIYGLSRDRGVYYWADQA